MFTQTKGALTPERQAELLARVSALRDAAAELSSLLDDEANLLWLVSPQDFRQRKHLAVSAEHVDSAWASLGYAAQRIATVNDDY